MKKVLIIILFLTICNTSLFAKEVWKNLGNGIYINTQSIKKENDGYITAIFKTYASDEHDLYDVDGIKVYYDIQKWGALCNTSKVLNIYSAKLYDKNGNLLEAINDNGQGVTADYSAYIYGETYYKTLCGHK